MSTGLIGEADSALILMVELREQQVQKTALSTWGPSEAQPAESSTLTSTVFFDRYIDLFYYIFYTWDAFFHLLYSIGDAYVCIFCFLS